MKHLAAIVVFVLALSLVPSVNAQDDRPTITQQQLLSLQAATKAPAFTLLDVRSAEEYQEGHIKGAVNISHSTLADNLAKLAKNKDTMVIVYCRSGRRAGIAEGILRDNGFTNVKHLDGDMKGWLANQLSVVK